MGAISSMWANAMRPLAASKKLKKALSQLLGL